MLFRALHRWGEARCCASGGCLPEHPAWALRFGVESGWSRPRRYGSQSSRSMTPLGGHSSRTKSVIRDGPSLAPQMVTGEFYASVTVRCITCCLLRPEAIRDKRPACGRLRSSKEESQFKAVLLSNRYLRNFGLSWCHDAERLGDKIRECVLSTLRCADRSLLPKPTNQ